MKKIRLEVNEIQFEKIFYFLENLPREDVKIIFEEEENLKLSNRSKRYETRKERDSIFSAITLQTKGFKFNRDEAHGR